MKSFPQYYQDKAIDFALNRRQNGIFLDIGVHDRLSLSNTHISSSITEIGQVYALNPYQRCLGCYSRIVVVLSEAY